MLQFSFRECIIGISFYDVSLFLDLAGHVTNKPIQFGGWLTEVPYLCLG